MLFTTSFYALLSYLQIIRYSFSDYNSNIWLLYKVFKISKKILHIILSNTDNDWNTWCNFTVAVFFYSYHISVLGTVYIHTHIKR